MKKYLLAFNFILGSLSINAQAAINLNDPFFDRQTIIAMIIGALAGIIGTIIFQRSRRNNLK